MPNALHETVNESSLWWSPLMDWATALAPRVGWTLGVELVRGGLLLLVIAVAIRAAGGVRARYRILGAGVVFALLMPLAGMSPGVWRVGVPYEMNRGGAAVREARESEPVAGELVETRAPDTVFDGATQSAVAPMVALRTTDQRGRLASVSPTVDGSSAVATGPAPSAAPAPGFEVLGWSIGDVRALGDEAMGLANAAAAQPLAWVGLWAAGALGVLLWGVAGVVRLSVIARAAQPADDRWVLEAERVMGRLGIRRSVRVVVSGSVPVPMTWGVWRPIVVVPTAGNAWHAERRRVVLTHELVHVRRLDWALQVAAWVVVSLHWCNPLAWWAVRRLAVERERSCDAAVVACGTRPSAYASHLLDIARAMSDVRSPVHALGMAKASELEGRLMSILNGTRRGAKRSVGAAVLVMFAGLAAAAVAPQAIPPEKQAELERREAELAELEARLAQKRAALEKARAEAMEAEEGEALVELEAEMEAQAEYEGQLRRAEPRGAVVVREARPARGVRAVTVTGEPRAPRAPRPARRVGVTEPAIAVIGKPTPPSAPEPATVVSGKLSRVHSGALQRWAELSQDKAALAEKLGEYKLRESPELAGALQKLDTISAELDGKALKLEGIASKLEPFQAKLRARQERLEPQQMHLRELQERLHAEMSAVQHQAHERHGEQAVISKELKQREMEVRDRIAAVGAEIEQAARKGDLDRLRELEGKITKLVDERDRIAQEAMVLADQHRQNADQFRGQSEQQRAQIEEEVRREMDRVHAEMEGVHEGMDELHHGMEGVHQEMEGVHVEMEAVHEKMEGVHERIEQIIREVVREIIEESLAEQGLSPDNAKAKKVIAVAKAAMGRRMMMTGADETEMVHITDPAEHFLKMREAIAKAEAEGDLRLSEQVERKLEAALKRAADRSEVLRFKVGEVHGRGEN